MACHIKHIEGAMFSAILSSYLFMQLNLNQLPLRQVAVTLNYKKMD